MTWTDVGLNWHNDHNRGPNTQRMCDLFFFFFISLPRDSSRARQRKKKTIPQTSHFALFFPSRAASIDAASPISRVKKPILSLSLFFSLPISFPKDRDKYIRSICRVFETRASDKGRKNATATINVDLVSPCFQYRKLLYHSSFLIHRSDVADLSATT